MLVEFLQAVKKKNISRHGGVRLTLTAMLEKARIPVQIDVGFGDAVTPQEIEETLPTILNLPAPRLKIYSQETVNAEKFEAMVKLGIANSRMKEPFLKKR